MITQDQLKDVLERADALHRYLEIDKKKIEYEEEDLRTRQYLDNTENQDRSLPCYSVSNASVSYTLKPKKAIKEAIFGLNFNNIFNRRYAANGWVYSAIYASGGHDNDNRYYQIGFIPMAGFTMMGNVTLISILLEWENPLVLPCPHTWPATDGFLRKQ